MFRTALLVPLLLAAPTLAQDAAESRPLDPALSGTWELVEMVLPDADVEVVRFTLAIEGDSVTIDRVVRIGEEVREQRYTVACGVAERVIACAPSADGTAGYSNLGQYEVEGDTLRLSLPDTSYQAVFRRVGEE